jgi:hypothetical protein
MPTGMFDRLTSRLVLAAQNSVGVWETKVLSRRHNARNKVEADRVREEHPGEEEVIHQGRTLGLITLTRGERYKIFLTFAIIPMSTNTRFI